MGDVVDGTLIRYMHANGASLFLFLMFMHVARRVYYNSSNKKHLWVSRVVILLLSMGAAFLRYVLPYRQMSYWGDTVMGWVGCFRVHSDAFLHSPFLTALGFGCVIG